MKARLLQQDQDFDPQAPLPWQAEALVKDLELTTLFGAMAQDDEFVFAVARTVLLAGLTKDPGTIRYRQDILQDCLNQPAAVRELYGLAVEAVELEKRQYFSSYFLRSPDSVRRGAIEHLEMFLELIGKLAKFTGLQADKFVSAGWAAFFTRLKQELNREYLAGVKQHLEQLKFGNGMLFSAGLAEGNKGGRYLLHPPPPGKSRTWWKRLLAWLAAFLPWRKPQPPACGFTLHPRDESGARALAELSDRGISLAAIALAQARDQVRDFFRVLRAELAFYLGCLNLHAELARLGEPVCLPEPAANGEGKLSFHGLYDVCLALNMGKRVVGNDANADRQDLVIVTGANQGGKSTFLRSVGLAQLMMQGGMFAPAESFCASIRAGLFTHFKREEDTGLKSGKLDEELVRMSDIVDHVTPHAMVLLNESFAATNEREGSEIARQIITALVDARIRVVCVTHLYELARGLHESNPGNRFFLRAEREAGGARTFKLKAGEPLPTSFAEDLYNRIFGSS